MPWLKHLCTEQIVVEVHRIRGHVQWSVERTHALMTQLHRHGYRVAFAEPNARYPKLGTEYTMVRNRTCEE